MSEIIPIVGGFIMALNELQFYVDEFKSNQCYCGNKKRPNTAFCYSCYSSLPQEMQEALYKRLGFGYEEAYHKAIQFLESQKK
jgi:hypothetical protein